MGALTAARLDDKDHQQCAEFFADPPPGPLVLPSTVLIEACWLINSRMGAAAHTVFLERISADLATGGLQLVELRATDVSRMAELSNSYRDAHLDPTDLSIIVLAERLQGQPNRPLDRRDFTIVRPRHCTAFMLLP